MSGPCERTEHAEGFLTDRQGKEPKMDLVKSFLSNESGTETVEWGLMVGLIVGGLVLVVAGIGTWVNGRFEQLQTDLEA